MFSLNWVVIEMIVELLNDSRFYRSLDWRPWSPFFSLGRSNPKKLKCSISSIRYVERTETYPFFLMI